MLGSTDLIGNPVGQIDKIVRGGKAIGKNPLKLPAAVVSAGTGMISKVSGGLFNIAKKITGEDEVERKEVNNAFTGFGKGVAGGLKEVYGGLTGLVVKPFKGA